MHQSMATSRVDTNSAESQPTINTSVGRGLIFMYPTMGKSPLILIIGLLCYLIIIIRLNRMKERLSG